MGDHDMTPRRAPEAVLVALAEAAAEYTRQMRSDDVEDPDFGPVDRAYDAYRAAVSPLRTRAEVDADRLQAARELYNEACDHIHFRHRWSELAREPTADEPEPNATTDHGADLRDPEPCSCEEAEALKRKLADIETECDLWYGKKKPAPAAFAAIGLIIDS